MKYVGGIDIGTRMTKAVLIPARTTPGCDATILACASVPTRFDLAEAAERALAEAMAEEEVWSEQLAYLATTGYGRYLAKNRDIQITEITCHSRGAVALMPTVRTLLDVGAQNARAIRLAPSGRVLAFRMNDKCASGAGRFVERVAKALEIDLGEVGPLGLRSEAPCEISSICAVLAESEVINHVTNGESISDILQGTHHSIAERLASLIRQVHLEEPIGLTGGVSKNRGLLKALQERLGAELHTHPESEYAGALGAALLGRSRLLRRTTAEVA